VIPGLIVVGLNHTRGSIEVRERLAVDSTALPDTLADLLAATGLGEALLLATCNRVEVWAIGPPEGSPGPVTRWLGGRSGLGTEALTDLVYAHRGLEALRHMARVASSLDSMVVGEPQILGQVRAAHAAAAAHGAAGQTLGAVVGQALRIARRVRTETEIGRGAVSVSSVAVELARKIFGDLRARAILLLGAGEMGALCARYLADLGVSRLTIASRTLDRAEAVARATGGKAVPFAEFPGHAAVADILICAASATGLLVTRADVERWIAARPRPLCLIDLGVPRNVDPAVARISDVYLHDVDGLEGIVEQNRRARAQGMAQAEALISEAVVRLWRTLAARQAAPTIRSLRTKIEEIRRSEVERAVARLGSTPEARATLEAMSSALVNKILHGPIEQLKAAQTAPEGGRLRAIIRDLFGLGDGPADGDDPLDAPEADRLPGDRD
jgi:glutamyl-tRNA reductase